MKPNLRPFDRFVRFVLGALLLFAAAVLFEQPVARIIATIAGLFSLFESVSGTCSLYGWLGVRSPKDALKMETLALLGLLGIQGALAYEWWVAGWEKISTSDFVAGMTKTLELFASKNPFPWYATFLRNVALPHATWFAYAVEWGEVAVGIMLVAAICVYLYSKDEKMRRCALWASVIALVAAAKMNVDFYLAAAWMSPDERAINVVMFWTELMLIFVWLSMLMQKKR